MVVYLIYGNLSPDFLYAQQLIEWQRCLGGMNNDYGYSVVLADDGGYAVAGTSGSRNGDVAGCHLSNEYWVAKLDASGNLQWQKCLGGNDVDEAYSIAKTSDGGYVVAGYSCSIDGDVTGNHGSNDF